MLGRQIALCRTARRRHDEVASAPRAGAATSVLPRGRPLPHSRQQIIIKQTSKRIGHRRAVRLLAQRRQDFTDLSTGRQPLQRRASLGCHAVLLLLPLRI
jgi:hypothetical protein